MVCSSCGESAPYLVDDRCATCRERLAQHMGAGGAAVVVIILVGIVAALVHWVM